MALRRQRPRRLANSRCLNSISKDTTTTEAAVVGVVGALILAKATGSFTMANFVDNLEDTIVASCMMTFILACAVFLANATGFAGLPKALAEGIGIPNLSPVALLLMLTVLYIILGCFLGGISIGGLTTSDTMPRTGASRIGLIWFTIYIVLVSGIGPITPPISFNLFVLQSLSGIIFFHVARQRCHF